MDQLIYVWLKLGHFVYPVAWIGSVVLEFVTIGIGILVGLAACFIWLVLLQIFWWRVYKGWIWE